MFIICFEVLLGCLYCGFPAQGFSTGFCLHGALLLPLQSKGRASLQAWRKPIIQGVGKTTKLQHEDGVGVSAQLTGVLEGMGACCSVNEAQEPRTVSVRLAMGSELKASCRSVRSSAV